ncbi:hypothetical protein BJX68DRAFT_222686 [Aspergillus pseudodeflectus]|uniref:Uncharacterized protein n=1 Tax=Aspergillus pseudodeflectus TaxID=176178 RepID=A0ABR4LAX5_9EURO
MTVNGRRVLLQIPKVDPHQPLHDDLPVPRTPFPGEDRRPFPTCSATVDHRLNELSDFESIYLLSTTTVFPATCSPFGDGIVPYPGVIQVHGEKYQIYHSASGGTAREDRLNVRSRKQIFFLVLCVCKYSAEGKVWNIWKLPQFSSSDDW